MTVHQDQPHFIEWSLIKLPPQSLINLHQFDGEKEINFITEFEGEYLYQISYILDGKPQTFSANFLIFQFFPFDISKLEITVEDKEKDIQELITTIKNQAWVVSYSLEREELKKIIDKHNPGFKIIGYDSIFGFLIEFDDEDQTHLEAIENIRNDDKIDTVFNRLFEGKNAFSGDIGGF